MSVDSPPSILAVFAHPDDIEFVAAGTLLLLQQRGWSVHYLNLCTGSGGSVRMGAEETARRRLGEAQEAARRLGATFHAPLVPDLELTYTVSLLRKVAAVVRECRPAIVLTHSPSDYMEDHTVAQRLAVTAAFSHGLPNFLSDPPREAFFADVTVYHALPHGLRDPLRRRIHAGSWVNTASVQDQKRHALAAHESQQEWLEISQGINSYLAAMDEASRAVGAASGQFTHAEGWRRHSHLGFSAREIDPLQLALGDLYLVNEAYEADLDS